jgi:hypothetical protein
MNTIKAKINAQLLAEDLEMDAEEQRRQEGEDYDPDEEYDSFDAGALDDDEDDFGAEERPSQLSASISAFANVATIVTAKEGMISKKGVR